MEIGEMRIHPYGFIIVLSVLIGMLYIYQNLKKEKIQKSSIGLYFILYIAFAFIGGKLFTYLTNPKDTTILTAGLSAYGGLIGTIASSIIFEKIQPSKGMIIKYTVLALPLIYSLSKIACFLSGCCYGIPYNGPFSITYTNGLNIPLFPIQLVETICFGFLFLLIHKMKKKPNIEYFTIIGVSILKFSLDFLRYDHIHILITVNQIFSIILLIVTIIYMVYKKNLKA